MLAPLRLWCHAPGMPPGSTWLQEALCSAFSLAMGLNRVVTANAITVTYFVVFQPSFLAGNLYFTELKGKSHYYKAHFFKRKENSQGFAKDLQYE